MMNDNKIKKAVYIIFFLVFLCVFVLFVPVKKNVNDNSFILKRYENNYYSIGYKNELFAYVGSEVFNIHLICNSADEYIDSATLEYCFDSERIKEVFFKEYSTCFDFYCLKKNYLLNDNYLLIDEGGIGSQQYNLYIKNKVSIPRLAAENIEYIEQNVGVYFHQYYSHFKIEELGSPCDSYVADKKIFYSNDYIKDFVTLLESDGGVSRLVINTKATFKDYYDFQKQYYSNDLIEVYYKIKFKNTDFPFLLVLEEYPGFNGINK